jgi:hypothetical protein
MDMRDKTIGVVLAIFTGVAISYFTMISKDTRDTRDKMYELQAAIVKEHMEQELRVMSAKIQSITKHADGLEFQLERLSTANQRICALEKQIDSMDTELFQLRAFLMYAKFGLPTQEVCLNPPRPFINHTPID